MLVTPPSFPRIGAYAQREPARCFSNPLQGPVLMFARSPHVISPQPYVFNKGIPLLEETQPMNPASRHKTAAPVSTCSCNEIAIIWIVYTSAISAVKPPCQQKVIT